MLHRRDLILGLAAAALLPSKGLAAKPKKRFTVDPEFEPQPVSISLGYEPGTIVIHTGERFLYLVEDASRARRYGIGVGRSGLAWNGTAEIGRKAKWPSWRPTDNMIRRNPKRYARYAGGMPGGPKNPLGSRALYLYRDGRDTMYRIHGTNEPWTIGKAVSNGCIRMINDHVNDLYERVPVGTQVVVLA